MAWLCNVLSIIVRMLRPLEQLASQRIKSSNQWSKIKVSAKSPGRVIVNMININAIDNQDFI